MKNKKYNSVGKIQKSNIKIVAQSIPLTHKYKTAHFPGLVQTLQKPTKR